LALQLAGIPADQAQGYAFRAEEVKQTAFRLDGLLIPPPDAPEAPLLFLEAQAQPDEAFYGRFFAEMFLYLHRRAPRQPWRALVLYPRRATERLDARYAEMLALPWVRRIYLEDLAAIPDLGFGLQLLSLLVEDPTAVASHAQRLAQQTRAQAIPLPLLPLECLDLLETLLVYRLPQLTRQEIQTMLGFTHAELKQSRFYQEVTAESRQEGRLEESVTLTLRLLKRRLGSSLSALHQQHVRQLSLEQTEALAEAVFDFQTAADLTAWLAALPERKTSSPETRG
jgi:predicted transposase/invertase (TIGR01784 family)